MGKLFEEFVVPIVNHGTFPVKAHMFTLFFGSFMHHKSVNELTIKTYVNDIYF